MCSKIEHNIIEAITITCCEYSVTSPSFLKIGVLYLGILHKVYMCIMLLFYCVAILNFLLRVYSRYPNSAMGEGALKMTLFTLKAMANGGMHDHVGQVRMYVCNSLHEL